MHISKEEVRYVGKLARLELTEAEEEAFSRQLSSILTYFEELRSFETNGLEPTATMLTQTNVVRRDEVHPSLPVGHAIRNAPASDGGYFCVPSILEERRS